MQQMAKAPALRDGDCEAEDRFVFGFAAALVAKHRVGVGRGRARALAQELLDAAESRLCLPGELDHAALVVAIRGSGLHPRLLPTVVGLLGSAGGASRAQAGLSLAS